METGSRDTESLETVLKGTALSVSASSGFAIFKAVRERAARAHTRRQLVGVLRGAHIHSNRGTGRPSIWNSIRVASWNRIRVRGKSRF